MPGEDVFLALGKLDDRLSIIKQLPGHEMGRFWLVVVPHSNHFIARLPESLTPTELIKNFCFLQMLRLETKFRCRGLQRCNLVLFQPLFLALFDLNIALY